MSATSILCVLCSFFSCYDAHRYLHSFPTRRSSDLLAGDTAREARRRETRPTRRARSRDLVDGLRGAQPSAPRTRLVGMRSEEHTSELQSRGHLVCRLLLEKKKITDKHPIPEHYNSR